jgi:hypothetical protein
MDWALKLLGAPYAGSCIIPYVPKEYGRYHLAERARLIHVPFETKNVMDDVLLP